MTRSSFQPIHNPWRYLVALGSNLPERDAHISQAIRILTSAFHIKQSSSVITTTPVPSSSYFVDPQGFFLNAVVDIASQFTPALFYQALREIEDRIGHQRQGKGLPRAIDLDILFAAQNDHDDFACCTPVSHAHGTLRIPHCEILRRAFLMDLIDGELGISPHALMRHFASTYFDKMIE